MWGTLQQQLRKNVDAKTKCGNFKVSQPILFILYLSGRLIRIERLSFVKVDQAVISCFHHPPALFFLLFLVASFSFCFWLYLDILIFFRLWLNFSIAPCKHQMVPPFLVESSVKMNLWDGLS